MSKPIVKKLHNLFWAPLNISMFGGSRNIKHDELLKQKNPPRGLTVASSFPVATKTPSSLKELILKSLNKRFTLDTRFFEHEGTNYIFSISIFFD